MPHVVAFKPRDEPQRWMTLAEACWWVIYRGEREDWLALGGDLDRPVDEHGSVSDLRQALLTGKLAAFGRVGEGGFADGSEPINAVEWEWRIVAPACDRLLAEPYDAIYVERRALRRLFRPVGVAVRGRPEEYAWDEIMQLHDQEAGELGPSQAAEYLHARCKELWPGRKVPAVSTLKPRVAARRAA